MTKQSIHTWCPAENTYVEIPLISCPVCNGWTLLPADLITGKLNTNHCKKYGGHGFILDPTNKYVIEARNENLHG